MPLDATHGLRRGRSCCREQDSGHREQRRAEKYPATPLCGFSAMHAVLSLLPLFARLPSPPDDCRLPVWNTGCLCGNSRCRSVWADSVPPERFGNRIKQISSLKTAHAVKRSETPPYRPPNMPAAHGSGFRRETCEREQRAPAI